MELDKELQDTNPLPDNLSKRLPGILHCSLGTPAAGSLSEHFGLAINEVGAQCIFGYNRTLRFRIEEGKAVTVTH